MPCDRFFREGSADGFFREVTFVSDELVGVGVEDFFHVGGPFWEYWEFWETEWNGMLRSVTEFGLFCSRTCPAQI